VLFRVVLSIAFAVYVAARPEDNLTSLVRAWASYALVDGIAALALLSVRETYFGSLVIQGIWGLVAAFLGFFVPFSLQPVFFVAIPLWAAGSTVLALVGVQQTREIIESRWLFALAVLGAAAGAFTFVAAADSNITWLKATIAGFSVANSVVFLLTALSVRSRRALG
jgi:uncharacterized membrane protein HdeD (DUF308 family)